MWISSRSLIVSAAVVEPSEYFLVRSGSTLVLDPLNTLALIRVSGIPRAAVYSFTVRMPT